MLALSLNFNEMLNVQSTLKRWTIAPDMRPFFFHQKWPDTPFLPGAMWTEKKGSDIEDDRKKIYYSYNKLNISHSKL